MPPGSYDEKARSGGPSLRAPQDRMVVLTRGERQHRGDVVGFQVGRVGEDFIVGRTCCQKSEHVLHTEDRECGGVLRTQRDRR